MSTHEYLITLLKELERIVPPPANCHHVISYCRYGSQEEGWDDRLAAQLNVDGTFIAVFFEDQDFDEIDPKPLAQDIAGEARKTIEGKQPQKCVGPGQYWKSPFIGDEKV